MTPTEFASRMVGKPWKRWQASWDGCDCYGIVVLYFREVLGVDLGPVPQTDIATGFAEAAGWQECGPEAGATCFMSWHNGAPTHCGVLLPDGRLLHSSGTEAGAGSVRVSRLSVVAMLYGQLKFYRYKAC